MIINSLILEIVKPSLLPALTLLLRQPVGNMNNLTSAPLFFFFVKKPVVAQMPAMLHTVQYAIIKGTL